jgi:hypothetical protein
VAPMWTPPPPILTPGFIKGIPLYTPEAPYSRGPQTPLSVPESQEGGTGGGTNVPNKGIIVPHKGIIVTYYWYQEDYA